MLSVILAISVCLAPAVAGADSPTLGYWGSNYAASSAKKNGFVGGWKVKRVHADCPLGRVVGPGDVIIAYDDMPVRRMKDFLYLLRDNYEVGDSVTVDFWDGEAIQKVEVELTRLSPDSTKGRPACVPVESEPRVVEEQPAVEAEEPAAEEPAAEAPSNDSPAD